MDRRGEVLLTVAATETHPGYQENHFPLGDMDLVPEPPLDKQERNEREAGVGWQRNEDYALLCKELELQDGELSEEEIILLEYFGKNFLEEFPRWKQDQEEITAKLCALADEVDTGHKTTTKINVAANYTAVVSGVLSVLGYALAPVTAGGSLVLSAAGQTLGAVAGVTSIVTNQLESSRNKKAQERASQLGLPTGDPELGQAGEEKSTVTAATEAVLKCSNTFETIKKSKQAYQIAKARPQLATTAKRLLTGGKASTRSARSVQKAFAGTPLAMTKKALRMNGALAVFFLGQDVLSLWKERKHLQDGARAKLAEDLRAQAQEQEELLAKVTQLHEKLRQKILSKDKKTHEFIFGESRRDSASRQP